MTRVLTAAVIIGLLLAVLASPPWVFTGAVLLIALRAWHEYAKLASALGTAPVAAPGALLCLAIVLSFASPAPADPLPVIVAAALLGTVASLRDHYGDPGGVVGASAATTAGLAWIGVLLGCQVAIRMRPDGMTWLLLLYATVAVGDSAAYYGGSTLGRRRLAPRLSPNKTIEGSLFGVAGSAVAAALVALWLPALTMPVAAGLGVALGLAGQVGDLLESSLKRAAGVKDSSDLLPGHGGVLDRIDAHLLAGGVLWLVLTMGLVG